MKIEVNTHLYEFNHGSKPRGTGTWIFELMGRGTFSVNALYAEAKRQAIEKAKSLKVTYIRVLP